MSTTTVVELAHLYSVSPHQQPLDTTIDLLSAEIATQYYSLLSQGWYTSLTETKYTYSALVREWGIKHIPVGYDGMGASGLFSAATTYRFKAIHDYHHWLTLNPKGFCFESELLAYKQFVQLLPTKIQQNKELIEVLFSEIVLQAAYWFANKHTPELKTVLSPLAHQYLQ